MALELADAGGAVSALDILRGLASAPHGDESLDWASFRDALDSLTPAAEARATLEALSARFNIGHSTLQVETDSENACRLAPHGVV